MKRQSAISLPLFSASLLLVVVLAASNVHAQATSCSVLGQVRISPGNAISKPILVTLQGRGTVVGQAYTDEEGHFYFNNLPGNVYHIVINEDGYIPINERVVSDVETSPMRMVNIYLIPRTVQKPSDPTVAGENPYLTNEAEYGKLYPPGAVKEFKAGEKADRKRKPDDAIAHYTKAIELAPSFYMARNNLGTLYMGKANYAGAEEQFEKVISINPNDASAYFNLGNLCLLKNQYDRALQLVDQGLNKQQSSAFGNFLRGSIYSRQNNTQEAEVAYRRSLELDPQMAQTHLALVNLFMQEKRSADAVAELKAFLKEFPEHQFAPKAREVLKKLENPTAHPN